MKDATMTVFHITTLESEDGEVSLRTRSGRSLRFRVLESEGELFRYSVARPRLGVYVYSNSLGELREMLKRSLLDGWRNAFLNGPASRERTRIGRNLCRVFQET